VKAMTNIAHATVGHASLRTIVRTTSAGMNQRA
jgi:hypothetical protein